MKGRLARAGRRLPADQRPGTLLLTGVLAVGSLVLASCSDSSLHGSTGDTGAQGAELPNLPGFAEHELPGGTVWLLAGHVANQANVYRLDTRSGQVEQVTDSPYGVTWLSASDEGVVISDSISGPEVPSIIRDGEPVPLKTDNPKRTSAYQPSIASDGRIAFTRVVYPERGAPGGGGPNPGDGTESTEGPLVTPSPRPASWLRWELVIQPYDSERSNVVYTSLSPLGPVAWGPGDRIATWEGSGDTPGQGQVVVLRQEQGVARTVSRSSALEAIGVPVWSSRPGTPLAVNGTSPWKWNETGDAVLVDVPTGEHLPMPRGWTARCWGPSGEHLILAKKRKVGMVARGNPEQVTVVETLPESMGTLYGCGWGPADP